MNTELVTIPTDVVTLKGVRYAPSGTTASAEHRPWRCLKIARERSPTP
jgi:hypothetical protein